jgi:hypothetical protein
LALNAAKHLPRKPGEDSFIQANQGTAIMNRQDTTRETLASNEEFAQRLAKVELRVAAHGEILNFLKVVLDQLKEGDYRLVLTDEQRAALNRWLGEIHRSRLS